MLCSLFRSPRHVNRAKGEAEGIHTFQAPVVQRLDNAIHRINRYPADNY